MDVVHSGGVIKRNPKEWAGTRKEIKMGSCEDVYEVNEYERGDCCYAMVTGRNSTGIYLELDNGQSAFSYNGACLQNGIRILCTIVKPAAPEKYRRTLVRLDSIGDFCDACP